MRIRSAAAALLVAALMLLYSLARLDVSAQGGRIMPLAEVKAGMVGVGRTVFEGTELSEFKVHIIGVLRNIQGPKRDLILVDRLGTSDIYEHQPTVQPTGKFNRLRHHPLGDLGKIDWSEDRFHRVREINP